LPGRSIAVDPFNEGLASYGGSNPGAARFTGLAPEPALSEREPRAEGAHRPVLPLATPATRAFDCPFVPLFVGARRAVHLLGMTAGFLT